MTQQAEIEEEPKAEDESSVVAVEENTLEVGMAAFEAMSETERMTVLDLYCVHCGIKFTSTANGYCECWAKR